MTDQKIVFETSETTHWKNLFPSKAMLLGSHNLNEGEELIAEITGVQVQKIRNTNGKEEEVPVMQFTNAPPMVLNVTNTRTISSLYGDLYERWTGKHIQLYATEVQAFGQKTTALRVRQVIPNIKQDLTKYENDLRNCKTMDELKTVFMNLPKNIKPLVDGVKNEVKGKLNGIS